MSWVDRFLDLVERRALGGGYIQREADWLLGSDGHILVAVRSGEEIPEGKGRHLDGMVGIFGQARSFAPSCRTNLAALREWVGDLPEPGECQECKGTKTVACRICRGEGEVECSCSECGDEHDAECGDCDGSGKDKCDACGLGRAHPARVGTIAGVMVNRNLLVGLLPDAEPDMAILIGHAGDAVAARTDDWCMAVMPFRGDGEAPALTVEPA